MWRHRLINSINIFSYDMTRLSTFWVVLLFFLGCDLLCAQDKVSVQTCEYWFDYDFINRHSVAMENGSQFQKLYDLSSLPRGLHSIGLRFEDNNGRWSAPLVKHFVIPSQPEQPIGGVASYEYWFNHGQRVRMAVNMQRELILSDLAIEIKDVIPNTISADYTFNTEEETVYCPDNVTFGIQAFDDIGHPTSAVISESFTFNVPVDPHILNLQNGVPFTFTPPTAGHMQGFKVDTEKDDSIMFTLNATGNFDLYDGEGHIVDCTTLFADDTSITYKAKATTSVLYALLWNVPMVMDNCQILYTNQRVSNITTVSSCKDLIVKSSQGMLTVTHADDGLLEINAVSGLGICHQYYTSGTQLFYVPAGLYVVRYKGISVKAIVK